MIPIQALTQTVQDLGAKHLCTMYNIPLAYHNTPPISLFLMFLLKILNKNYVYVYIFLFVVFMFSFRLSRPDARNRVSMNSPRMN